MQADTQNPQTTPTIRFRNSLLFMISLPTNYPSQLPEKPAQRLPRLMLGAPTTPCHACKQRESTTEQPHGRRNRNKWVDTGGAPEGPLEKIHIGVAIAVQPPTPA